MNSIGGRRHIHRKEGRLQIERQFALFGLPRQLLCTQFNTADVTIFRRNPTRAAKDGHQIHGLVGYRCPMFLRDLFKASACQIGKRRNCREKVVNMCHERHLFVYQTCDEQ
jgi:hypothetical protein